MPLRFTVVRRDAARRSVPRAASHLVAALGAAAVLVPASVAEAAPAQRGGDDVTVVAVIDTGFSPYHWDYSAHRMPQATNRDRSDDLPLTTAPDKWLAGFPRPSAFDSYQPLRLSLERRNPEASLADLAARDSAKWNSVQESSAGDVNYYWIPGSKVIGALSFGTGTFDTRAAAHGTGSASVGVGNLHGTCPECLLVFLQFDDAASGEAAINWAMQQPWIDAISNSYGFSDDGTNRTRLYTGADVDLQRAASSRGQAIFFSGGNGIDGNYLVPNSTYHSAQEGPDWIVTVGATADNGGLYVGTGKPVDVAAAGAAYPSAYRATTVTNGEFFAGTSNATPLVAGHYGRALYHVRRAIPGRSRMQDAAGVVARGRVACRRVHRRCELADGELTGHELRLRLLRSARSTGAGYSAPVTTPPTPRVADSHFAAEGHGTYLGRLRGPAAWQEEFNRLLNPLLGSEQPPARPDGEVDWFRTDSWCRQRLWGAWSGGYYVDDATTPLPPMEYANWPTREALRATCDRLPAAPTP